MTTKMWYLLLLVWALGILTGLLLSRLQDRRVARRYEPPHFVRRFWIAFSYWRKLGYSWSLAWTKAKHITRGEWI
mgnify:CR=1 FL=1